MAPANAFALSVHQARLSALGAEVFRGLAAQPKTLSPWLFYDAEGSALFESITTLPEYYVTRTERGIFSASAEEMIGSAAGDHRLAVVELGAGTAAKTGLLLQAVAARQGSVEYYPIDISAEALREAREHIEREFADVHVHPRVADYTDGLGRIEVPAGTRRLVLYIGSSIGNFEPEDASALLADVRSQLAPGDQLLLGVDLVKPVRILLDAYDDSAGITAAFNCNVLHRINRELGANFAVERFTHQARWNAERSRIEMHLCSQTRQQVFIPAIDLVVDFAPGESIHTESSYKFTQSAVESLLSHTELTIRRTWCDGQAWFGVYLLEAV